MAPTPSKKAAQRKQSTDALVLLRADHRTVEKLFKAFERAGDAAFKTKRQLADRMITELSIHAFIEEQILYPAAREVASAHDVVLEALEEHHVVKWQLQELIGLDPTNEHFSAKVTVLSEHVRHHVREEENGLFPLLREVFSRTQLRDLGAQLEKAKTIAPHHPHPRLPAGPPDQVLGDAVASVIDRAKQAVGSVRSA